MVLGGAWRGEICCRTAVDARAGLGCGAIPTAPRRTASYRSGNADYGAGAPARTRNNLPQSACGVSEAAGSEPAENGFSGLRSARVEDAAGGYQGLLRFDADRFTRKIVGQTKGHTGRVQGKLRGACPVGVQVLTCFVAGSDEVARVICAK